MPWWLWWLWLLLWLRPLRWQFLMTISDDNFWWQFLMTISDDNFWWQFLMKILMTISDDNFWWQFLMTTFDDNLWWQFLMTIFDGNFWWQFLMTISDGNFWWHDDMTHYMALNADKGKWKIHWKSTKNGRPCNPWPWIQQLWEQPCAIVPPKTELTAWKIVPNICKKGSQTPPSQQLVRKKWGTKECEH